MEIVPSIDDLRRELEVFRQENQELLQEVRRLEYELDLLDAPIKVKRILKKKVQE